MTRDKSFFITLKEVRWLGRRKVFYEVEMFEEKENI